MKKFNRILEQYVQENESLTRIRLKVDPKDRSGIDFRDFDGYEGYILKEGRYFNILIEGMDFPIMQVPFSIIKVVDIKDKDTFDRVKVAAIHEIANHKEVTLEFINKIGACNSVDFFEQYLKEEGLTDKDIKDIYKNFIFTNEMLSEAVDWKGIRDKLEAYEQRANLLKTGGKLALGLLFPSYGLAKAREIYGGARQYVNYKAGDYRQNTQADAIKNKLPKIPVQSTASKSLSTFLGTIEKHPIYAEQYTNRATNDVFIIEQKPAVITSIRCYNTGYIDIKNPVIPSSNLNEMSQYFNKDLLNEGADPRVKKESIFSIGRMPLLAPAGVPGAPGAPSAPGGTPAGTTTPAPRVVLPPGYSPTPAPGVASPLKVGDRAKTRRGVPVTITNIDTTTQKATVQSDTGSTFTIDVGSLAPI